MSATMEITLVGSLPAAAYVSTGYDPRDATAFDIRSTVRAVERGDHGRRLRIAVSKRLKHGTLRFSATAITCRVLVHPLHPTKAIRWNVAVGRIGEEPYDVAPDHGMYS